METGGTEVEHAGTGCALNLFRVQRKKHFDRRVKCLFSQACRSVPERFTPKKNKMKMLSASPAGSTRLHLACSVVLAGLSFTSAAIADFAAPYQYTPPPPGTYTTAAPGSTFGAWTLTVGSGDLWQVETDPTGPAELNLSVIDFVGG